jgi:hypothetical protein
VSYAGPGQVVAVDSTQFAVTRSTYNVDAVQDRAHVWYRLNEAPRMYLLRNVSMPRKRTYAADCSPPPL